MVLPVIDTNRIILRPIKKSDYKDFYEYGSNMEVCKFVSWGPIKCEKDALWMLKKSYLEAELNGYAIVYKENNKMIGIIDFHNISKKYQHAEIGYSLNYDYQNKGIMTQALLEVIKVGFMSLNFHRLEIRQVSNNEASKRVIEKADFRFEGISKEAYFDHRINKFYDVYNYAILKEEYIRGELKWQL